MKINPLNSIAALLMLVGSCGAAHATVDIISPVGDIDTSNPEFSWSHVPDVVTYRLLVRDQALKKRVHLQSYDSDDICENDICSVQIDTELGYSKNHRWRLRTRDTNGWNPWGGNNWFHYLDTKPETVNPHAPDGVIYTDTPEFTWPHVPNATKYRLRVDNQEDNNRLHLANHLAADVCNDGTCSLVVPGLEVPANKQMRFQVRANNSGGWNNWSASKYFVYQSAIANNDSAYVYSQNGDRMVEINLLENDSGINPDTVVLDVDNLTIGTVANGSEPGVIIYEASVGSSGLEVFSYEVTAGNGDVLTASIEIDVRSGINLYDDSAVVYSAFADAAERTVSIDLLANDNGMVDESSVDFGVLNLQFGTLSEEDGVISYQADENAEGIEIFSYNATDTFGKVSDTATITIYVDASDQSTDDPVDPTPVENECGVFDYFVSAEADTPILISLLEFVPNLDLTSVNTNLPINNAQNPAGAFLPAGGTLAAYGGDGTLTFNNYAGFTGCDEFFFEAESDGEVSEWHVGLLVEPIDDGSEPGGGEGPGGSTNPIITAEPPFCPAYDDSPLYRERQHMKIVSPGDDWEYEVESAAENTVVLLEDGTYYLDKPEYPTQNTIYLGTPNITIRSLSGNPGSVTIVGDGYPHQRSDSGIMIAADGITIADISIKQMQDHGISMQPGNAGGELNDTYIYNVVVTDIGTQHIKGNDNGINRDLVIACSTLGYTDGAVYGAYIGAVDIHQGDKVIVRDNYMFNITGDGTGRNAGWANDPNHYPDSGPAVFMNTSTDSIIERNIIEDSYRGISLGLVGGHTGGIVRNNFVYRSGAGDMGISIENTTGAVVEHNTVVVEGYQGPIEVRGGSDNIFRNNLTNANIWQRDNPSNTHMEGNITDAGDSDFATPGEYALSSHSRAIGYGTLPTTVTYDIDGDVREERWDVGADQYTAE